MNNTSNHTISIVERSSINISGVNKIESFDKEDFLLETVMGYMNIKGEDLEMVKLDTIEGKVVIKGKINSLMYSNPSSLEEVCNMILDIQKGGVFKFALWDCLIVAKPNKIVEKNNVIDAKNQKPLKSELFIYK